MARCSRTGSGSLKRPYFDLRRLPKAASMMRRKRPFFFVCRALRRILRDLSPLPIAILAVLIAPISERGGV